MGAKYPSGTRYVDFATRLIDAIESAGHNTSASGFARELNARSVEHVVTSYGARKWLTGEAIPTQNRLKLIAEVLGVSAAWLRFGEGAREATTRTEYEDSESFALLADFARLENQQKNMVRELVAILLRSQSYTQPATTASS